MKTGYLEFSSGHWEGWYYGNGKTYHVKHSHNKQEVIRALRKTGANRIVEVKHVDDEGKRV